MIVMRKERFGEIYPDIARMEIRQWQEVGMTSLMGRNDLKPEIDTAAYFESEKNGRLLCLAVRDGRALVGYVICHLARHPHYRSLIFSTNDTHYLLPEYRKRFGLGVRMMLAAEKMQIEAGPDILSVHSKLALNNERLWNAMGYQSHDMGFLKILKGPSNGV